MSSENSKEGAFFTPSVRMMLKHDTLPKNLYQNFLQKPGRVAMRSKERGIWQSYTWEDCYTKVKYFSLGLASLGLKRGDKVSILGDNKPQWYWAELAVQAVGGIAVGIFTDCIPSEVKFYVEHSGSKFVVAYDQEQIDKLLEIKEELPLLKKLIYWEPKGLWSYKEAILMSFDEVIEIGERYEKENPRFFEEELEKGKGEDIAAICYTSGTTGTPKGALIPHKMLAEAQREAAILMGLYGRKGYNYVSIIPGAWFSEQMTGIGGWVVSNQVVNFPEAPETVQQDLREIGPDILFYGARFWESVNRMVQARILDTTFFRRMIYKICLPVGLKVADLSYQRKRLGLYLRALYFVAFHAVFRQLRDRLGLSNLKIVLTGGAAISPEIIRYYKALGLDIALFYGTTEVGLVTLPIKGDVRPETCGKPTPWCDVKLSHEGEILVRTEFMYSGYYMNPEATNESVKDGWYYTGDYGYIDEDGYLIVIDRMKDMKQLAGGKKFSPQYAEARLRFSPYIRDVLILGSEETEYVSAVVNIDIDNAGRYAEGHHIPYTTYTDLSQKPEIIQIVKAAIAGINKTLPEHARIKKFANLHKEFDADEKELTRTRKIRRSFVEERYGEMISALNSDEKELKIESPITYRDGRKGVITTAIKINEVDSAGS